MVTTMTILSRQLPPDRAMEKNGLNTEAMEGNKLPGTKQ